MAGGLSLAFAVSTMRQLGHLEALNGRLALGFFGQDRQIILSVLSFVFDVPLMPSSRVYAHDAFVDSRISPYHEVTGFQLSLPTWANHQHDLAPLPPAANGEWVRQLSPHSYLINHNPAPSTARPCECVLGVEQQRPGGGLVVGIHGSASFTNASPQRSHTTTQDGRMV